nr:MAG TPA: hypothetical protein [Caudoviricetes sp.]
MPVVQQALPAHKARLVPQAPRVNRAIPEPQAQPGRQVLQVQKALLALVA